MILLAGVDFSPALSPSRPRRLLQVLSVAGLVAGSALYLLVGIREGLNFHDEGIWLYEAIRVLDGHVPYRDFWMYYTPGGCYLLAGLFALVGPSVVAVRVLTRLAALVIVLLSFWLARQLGPWSHATVAAAVVALWMPTIASFSGHPIVFATVCALLAFAAATHSFGGSRRAWLGAAGGFAGVATVFRHDIGGYTVVPIVAAILMAPLLGAAAERPAWKAQLPGLLAFIGATGAVVLPVAVLFAMAVDVRTLVSDLVLYPLFVHPPTRSLPWPAPIPNPAHLVTTRLGVVVEYTWDTVTRLQFYLPLLALPAAGIDLVLASARRRIARDRAALVLMLLLFGLLSLNQMRIRLDPAHVFPTILPVVILLAWMLARAIGLRRLAIGIALTVVAAFAVSHHWRWPSPDPSAFEPLRIERARGISVLGREAAELEMAVRFVDERVPPEERIFVGNDRHDRVLVGHTMFYFLSARHSATRYHIVAPGITTTRPVQRAIIDDLERRGVRYVVLWASRRSSSERNLSSQSSGVHDLDDYLRARFRVERIFGDYTILARKNEPGRSPGETPGPRPRPPGS